MRGHCGACACGQHDADPVETRRQAEEILAGLPPEPLDQVAERRAVLLEPDCPRQAARIRAAAQRLADVLDTSATEPPAVVPALIGEVARDRSGIVRWAS